MRELVDGVTFPEDAMAEVIRELLDELAIPPPYPEGLDPDWLLTLSNETRLALVDSWEDLRLRHWIVPLPHRFPARFDHALRQ